MPILGYCLESSPINLCDCQQDCWDTHFDTYSDQTDCTDTCNSTSAACVGAGTGCMADLDDSLTELSTEETNCDTACGSEVGDCETGCEDDTCLGDCALTYCQCQHGCNQDYDDGVAAIQNDYDSCTSECCNNDPTSPAKTQDLANANCILTCNSAFYVTIFQADSDLEQASMDTGCYGGDMTDAENALSVTDYQASYTQSECLCNCNVKNYKAQKVCGTNLESSDGGIEPWQCYCDCQKTWDTEDVLCFSDNLDTPDADTLLACQDANMKSLWQCQLVCCFSLFGGDDVSPKVMQCQSNNLDCIEGGGPDCATLLAACLKTVYAPPAVIPCTGCDKIFP